MFKLMGKKILENYAQKFCLSRDLLNQIIKKNRAIIDNQLAL